ncbi:MAG: hypothetical protein PVI01_04350 [Gemmatimonadales bacterium]|jgi:hypothetical protein
MDAEVRRRNGGAVTDRDPELRETTFRIFDTERGGCAHAGSKGGAGILVDCGVNDARGLRPAKWLHAHGQTASLRAIILSSQDDAYVADLEAAAALQRRARVYVAPAALDRAAKAWPRLDLRSLDRFSESVEPLQLDFFHNEDAVDVDPRDLSVITVLRTRTLGVLLGSDIQRAGWRALLEREKFREALRTVDVLVASDNGSPSGFCAQVFEICEPRLIVLQGNRSTIDSARVYADHASGLQFAPTGCSARRCQPRPTARSH